jgi:hypothetical protein
MIKRPFKKMNKPRIANGKEGMRFAPTLSSQAINGLPRANIRPQTQMTFPVRICLFGGAEATVLI